MRTSWRLMNWRGVPIVLNWTLLVVLPWFYYRHRNLLDMAMAFAAFFLVLLVHELGHAAVAKWRRITVLEIRLYIMHGLCLHEAPDKRSDDIWIAWGGVAAQFALLLIALAVSALGVTELHTQVALKILITANTFIILYNLLPLPGFDGATAWLVLPRLWERVPKPDVKQWLRNRKLRRQSKQVAADIIDRLKKTQ